MSVRKRYAIVGTGGRYAMFMRAIARDYSDTAEICGLCDINPHRVQVAREYLNRLGHDDVPIFGADQFDEMITTTRADSVIVT